MKLKYLLLAVLSMTLITANAQFTDSMESYTDGERIYEGHWLDWGCGGSCALYSSSAQAHLGNLSGLIPDDGFTDAVLDLGNKIFGQWGLGFYAYIPSGKVGYYNLQGSVPIVSGEWIVGNFYFNQDNLNPGVGLLDNTALGSVNFSFPHDEWFYIAMNVDISAGLSAATWEYWVDGVEVIPAGTPFTDGSGAIPTSLGGVDFFSISPNNMMWLDTFLYQEGFVPTDSGNLNSITGTILFDMDNNGCTAGDVLADNIMVTTTNGTNTFTTSTNSEGDYTLYVGLGTYTTSVSVNNDLFNVSPVSQSSNFTDYGNTDFIDFCVSIDVLADDVNVVLIPTSEARPGFDAQYQIVYNNSGSNTTNGDITLVFDDSKLVFLNADTPPDVINNNTMTWNYNNLLPFETRVINLNFNVFPPPQVEINDILMFTTSITPLVTDINDIDNTHEFNQIVIGSFDPNDKTVLEGDRLRIENIDNYLHYLIRFQNTGTASAIHVSVEDVLDDKLDWSTFTPISYSHTAQLEINNENNLRFIFNNIHLPDSTSNEPESHGHILFKVKPKANVVVGDIISGSAAIFFDFNPPVITNTVITEIVDNEAPIANDDTLVIVEGNTGSVDVASNDVDMDGTLDVTSIVVTNPPLYGTLNNNGDGTFTYIHDGSLNPEDYFRYTINDNEGLTSNVAVVSITIQSILGLNDFAIEKFDLYPNPASTEIHIEVGVDTFLRKLEIFDINGRLLSQNVPSQNSHTHRINITNLSSGIYFIAMTNQDGQRIIKKMIKE
ncbi:MAG: T9SS type A sorting domain-containing protein [Flavobacteriaceae bacterium]